jgi:hypothetical protein
VTDNGASDSAQEQRSRLFGSYKAEWLREQLFELFAEPAYFPELTAPSPCVLIGGRGTGKTTVLRCMSYEGQFALRGKDAERIPTWPYFGMYYRVNTNRVTAFSGPELDAQRWARTFGHYINLVFCDLAVRFLEWYQLNSPVPFSLPKEASANVAEALRIETAASVPELARNIARAKLRFESYINNIADSPPLDLSLQAAPLDELFGSIAQFPGFSGKSFFFLLDEYENFEDYQQQVVNTLIKHSGELYSFKIGVRELGWRVRSTLNTNEQLISPADYVRINIAEELQGEAFEGFACSVANERIRRFDVGGAKIEDVRSLLPGITEPEEARLLDRESGEVTRACERLREVATAAHEDQISRLSVLDQYCLVKWSDTHDESLRDLWESYRTDPGSWEARFNNYNHSLLYTIRKGKRGIRKYYAGTRVFTQLAASNIRYFLELVDQSIALHVENDRTLDRPVDVEAQTIAAQRVGKKNLSELEGLSVHGAKLTKLVLGLGRVFQVLAEDAFGHTPEVNQFHLSYAGAKAPDVARQEEVDNLLTAAVMHLALLRSPGSKLIDEADTREYDYMLHPIFSAFFVFSHRRKRKLAMTPGDLMALVSDHKPAIRRILATQKRDDSESLPDQLMLFGPYYDVPSEPSSSD